MANGKHQIEYLINEATERVAAQGTSAAPTDLNLAAFGYLAYKITEPRTKTGKKWVAGGLVGSAGVGAGVLELIRALLGG